MAAAQFPYHALPLADTARACPASPCLCFYPGCRLVGAAAIADPAADPTDPASSAGRSLAGVIFCGGNLAVACFEPHSGYLDLFQAPPAGTLLADHAAPWAALVAFGGGNGVTPPSLCAASFDGWTSTYCLCVPLLQFPLQPTVASPSLAAQMQ